MHRIWDAVTGEVLLTRTYDVPDLSAGEYKFSIDGRLVASTLMPSDLSKRSTSTEVSLWDSRTGRDVVVLHGHSGVIYRLAFSPDGNSSAGTS